MRAQRCAVKKQIEGDIKGSRHKEGYLAEQLAARKRWILKWKKVRRTGSMPCFCSESIGAPHGAHGAVQALCAIYLQTPTCLTVGCLYWLQAYKQNKYPTKTPSTKPP
jgi:hypothetical protein